MIPDSYKGILVFVGVAQSVSAAVMFVYVDAVILDFASYLAAEDGLNWDDLQNAERELYLERIQKGGYHIYTPLDMNVQRVVDEVYGDPSNLPKTSSAQSLQSGIVVIDNRTGDVVIMKGCLNPCQIFI